MSKPNFPHYFDFLNVRQQLRELDVNLHENADLLGLYSREFRIASPIDNQRTALTR